MAAEHGWLMAHLWVLFWPSTCERGELVWGSLRSDSLWCESWSTIDMLVSHCVVVWFTRNVNPYFITIR